MSRIIMRAEEHNRGLIYDGVWERMVWIICADSTYTLVITYRPEDGTACRRVVRGSFEPADYEALVQAVDKPWSDEKTEADDGTAWEFRTYGDRGEPGKHRELGYIYDIEPFESIDSILSKYLKVRWYEA